MAQFSQDFKPLERTSVLEEAQTRKQHGWRYVQLLAVNTEQGIDLVYSYMLDGLLENLVVKGVKKDEVVASITSEYLEAFVCENEIHDLFGVQIEGIAIDFGGNFYRVAQKEPMTIVSPEQLAAREKAKKIAAAKAAKEKKAAQAEHDAGNRTSAQDDLEAKLAGMDPEKAARVRAAMEAKAKKAAAEAKAAEKAALEEKLAGMDPEKAARVRAAMEAKAKKAQAEKGGE